MIPVGHHPDVKFLDVVAQARQKWVAQISEFSVSDVAIATPVSVDKCRKSQLRESNDYEEEFQHERKQSKKRKAIPAPNEEPSSIALGTLESQEDQSIQLTDGEEDSNESARSKKKAKEPQSTDNSSTKKAYEPERTHNPTNKKQSASTPKGDNSLITDTINTTKANTTTNSKQKAGTKQSASPLNTITSFFSAKPNRVPKTIPVVDTPDLDDDSDSGASEPINHKKTRSDARKKQNVTKSRNTCHKSKTKLLATKDTLDATLEDPNTTSSTKTSGSKEIPDSDDLGSLLEKKLTEAEKLVASAAGVNFVSQKVQETEPTPLYRIDKDAFPFRSSELRARSGTSKPPNDNTDIVRAWTPTNANEALEAPEMPAGKSKGSFTSEDV
ncbi:hypothetical protein LTR15_010795 [Elasticomyces elasticus]|nr:hypothetical protein LTR15_010795 [Elasticomyces elasticus]